MNENQLYTVKIFESKKRSRGNLFFVGPFTGKEIYFRPMISRLSDSYKIFYIQPKDESLSYNHPEKLAEAITQVGDFIKLNQIKPKGLLSLIKLKLGRLKNHNFLVATSLGSYIAYFNIPNFGFIDKYYFSATGGLITHTHEDKDFKKLMNFKDYSSAQLSHAIKVWSDYESRNLRSVKLKGKTVKIINSNYDKLITKKHTKEWFDLADLQGADLRFEYTNMPNHQAQALALNLYAKKIEEFFGS